MIEVDTVVECKSKEKENLEKFKRLQNITYLSNETITKPQKDTNKACRYGEGCKLKDISCRYQHPNRPTALETILATTNDTLNTRQKKRDFDKKMKIIFGE